MKTKPRRRENSVKSQQRGLCGRCKKEYDPYIILVKKCIPAYVELVSLREKYGWLCPECLNELMHSKAYAILPAVKKRRGKNDCKMPRLW